MAQRFAGCKTPANGVACRSAVILSLSSPSRSRISGKGRLRISRHASQYGCERLPPVEIVARDLEQRRMLPQFLRDRPMRRKAALIDPLAPSKGHGFYYRRNSASIPC
jgi:hypothetical protein